MRACVRACRETYARIYRKSDRERERQMERETDGEKPDLAQTRPDNTDNTQLLVYSCICAL